MKQTLQHAIKYTKRYLLGYASPVICGIVAGAAASEHLLAAALIWAGNAVLFTWISRMDASHEATSRLWRDILSELERR